MADVSQTPAEGPSQLVQQVEALQQRVQRLEERVLQLQDTTALEERMAARFAAPGAATPSPPLTIAEAGRRLLPRALGGRARPAGSAVPPPGGIWLLTDLYTEIRAMFWMFIDTRYRLSWTCRLVLPVVLFMAFMSWFLFDGRFVYIGSLIDRLIDLVLIVITYKVLSREALRYRQAVPDFPTKSAA
jgi:hypothetical protein